jgi:hypothetical protein
MWICRAQFPESFFINLRAGKPPSETPRIRLWGGEEGLNLLVKDDRSIAFNTILSRAREIEERPFILTRSLGPTSE